MKVKSILPSAIVISTLLAQVTFAALPRYEITDLGTLGGGHSSARAINDAGQVVGWSYTVEGFTLAFLWDTVNGMIDLGTLDGQFSKAYSINRAGQIVGQAYTASGYWRATLFHPTGEGNNIDLGTLGGDRSYASSINDNGQIVGWAQIASGEVHATLFDTTGGNDNVDLGTLGGDESWASSINNSSQIVGTAYRLFTSPGGRLPPVTSSYLRATLFDATGQGNNIDLGTLLYTYGVCCCSGAMSINDSGQIVGAAWNEDPFPFVKEMAVLFDPTGGENNIFLGTLGRYGSFAYSINNRAQIIGWGGFCSNNLCGTRPAIFDPTGQGNNVNLYDLIDPSCGWILQEVWSINNLGWIVGQGINPDGETHAFLMTPIPPKVIYVDDDAAGANDGLSWADAFNYLQDALAAAWSGDEIRVAQGIYTPDSNSADPNGSGDREATFQLINGVTIKGGYAGTGEPDPNARDIKEYRTILSGDLAGDDDFHFTNKGENCFHVVTGSGTDATAVLDGFEIWYGHANRQADPWGAGMYNDHGSPTVKNCGFGSNHALAEQGSMGGGMYNYYSSPELINCGFGGNSADVTDRNQAGGNGGGMYNNHSSPTLTNCTFRSNRVRDYGGGMYNIDSNPTLTYSTFKANHSSLYGAGMYNCRSTLTLTKCMFLGNFTYSDTGGAMYSTASDITLTNCTLTRNGATNGSSLACDSPEKLSPSNIEMTNCILWDHDSEIWNNDNSSIVISYSDVRGGWPGQGNINANPLFVNPGGVENFRLAESSPCIDTGDPNYIPEPNETDFDGFPRIVGGRIDMGVYEFQGRLILYVDNDAPGSNDGSSWINAYNCLQDALIPADPTGGPVEIRVAQGIYKPDQGAAVTPGDRAASFRIKARVTVKGGYAGFGEPDPNARNIKSHETILSGDLAGDDGQNFENNDENSYSIVTGGARGETTILDGFTITGGNANGPESFNTQGGGLRFFPDYGVTITNCTIIRNRAKSMGGGMHFSGWGGNDSLITNCRFTSNRSEGTGGALSLDGESSPDIINCVFSGNSAVSGGAIGNIEGYLGIINCTFTGNHALDECGGVIDHDGASNFINSILWANTDKGGADESAQFMFSWYWGPPVNYSCIQGWTGALGGIGNINEDPRFVDPGYWNANGTPDDANDDVWVDGDYHLLPDSPCIDTGDPNHPYDPNETDLDGKPRVMNSRIDMGAYELPIFAEARFVPRTINLASKGKSITCYIRLPESYNVADIDPNSVLLEQQIKAEQFSVDVHKQVATATFDRVKVQSILNIGDIELKITCQLTDGTYFEAKDIVQVTDKGPK